MQCSCLPATPDCLWRLQQSLTTPVQSMEPMHLKHQTPCLFCSLLVPTCRTRRGCAPGAAAARAAPDGARAVQRGASAEPPRCRGRGRWLVGTGAGCGPAEPQAHSDHPPSAPRAPCGTPRLRQGRQAQDTHCAAGAHGRDEAARANSGQGGPARQGLPSDTLGAHAWAGKQLAGPYSAPELCTIQERPAPPKLWCTVRHASASAAKLTGLQAVPRQGAACSWPAQGRSAGACP